MSVTQPRLRFIDSLKAIASQLILLHHLAFYGPLSEAAHRTLPLVFEWLARDARIAVQVFLVIGGFLAARSLAPEGMLATKKPFEHIRKRYFKLAIPLIGAVFVSIVLSAIARQMFSDDAIPSAPTILQILAHATLLHGILGVDSLSAGVWYIAIDFQLYTLLLGTLWVARRFAPEHAQTTAKTLILLLVTLSLLHFNRQSDWDNWAIYFIGAYGLGVLTFWNGRNKNVLTGLMIIAAIVGIALIIDFRSRILIALLTALSLGFAQYLNKLTVWPQNQVLAWLGKISYSVFLIHFPIILIINGIYARAAPTVPSASLYFAAIAWMASIAGGAVFYRYVENRNVALPALN